MYVKFEGSNIVERQNDHFSGSFITILVEGLKIACVISFHYNIEVMRGLYL